MNTKFVIFGPLLVNVRSLSLPFGRAMQPVSLSFLLSCLVSCLVSCLYGAVVKLGNTLSVKLSSCNGIGGSSPPSPSFLTRRMRHNIVY